MDETRTLKSGVELIVKLADFQDGLRLFKAVLNELKAVNIDVEKLDLNVDMTKMDGRMLNTFKNVFCQLIGSEAVEKALFNCAARSLYDGSAITIKLFNEGNKREDFLPVAWEVCRANLAPFFRRLDLKSFTSSPTATQSPPSG